MRDDDNWSMPMARKLDWFVTDFSLGRGFMNILMQREARERMESICDTDKNRTSWRKHPQEESASYCSLLSELGRLGRISSRRIRRWRRLSIISVIRLLPIYDIAEMR